MKTLAALFVMAAIVAASDANPVERALPTWLQRKVENAETLAGIAISTRLEAYFYRGDFDGDNTRDVAVFVKRQSDGKEGIAVLWGGGHAATLMGAGVAFGNGGDDFSWMTEWGVEIRGSHWGPYEKQWGPAREGIVVVRDRTETALIYFADGKPKWLERGF